MKFKPLQLPVNTLRSTRREKQTQNKLEKYEKIRKNESIKFALPWKKCKTNLGQI